MKTLSSIFLVLLSLSIFSFGFLSSTFALEMRHEQPLQAQAQLVPYQIEPHQTAQVEITLSLPEGYRAYEDQFALTVVSPAGFKISRIAIAPLKEFFDENTGKNKKGVIGEAKMTAVIEAPADLSIKDRQLQLNLRYQACTQTYCLFPIDLTLKMDFEPLVQDQPMPDKPFWQLKFDDILKQGLLWTFLFVFIAGLLTSFTPCIFPMIPITLSILGQHAHMRSKRHNIALAHVYVLGIALTYSTLGVAAAASGALFGSFMSHPAVLTVITLVFIAMALSMFGLYELQAPAVIRQRLGGDLKVHGYPGVFLYGVIAGVVASPCVGPVLVGVLTYIARTQNLWLGFWLMFVFALGMGQLFILIGVFSSFTKHLPRSGPWMDGVKNFFGLCMVGAAFYYLSLLLPSRWWDGALGLALIVLAIWFRIQLKALPETAKTRRRFFHQLWKSLCQSTLVVGMALLALAVFNLSTQNVLGRFTSAPQAHTLEPLEKAETNFTPVPAGEFEQSLEAALKTGRPIVIDFGAEWCAACMELEHKTFTHEEFKKLAPQFSLLKFNATDETPELEALKVKYNIVGLPTVLFYDRHGKLRTDLTVNEFIDGPAFAERMQKALE